MRWGFFVRHWTARLLADPDLISVMGRADFITPAQSRRPVEVPSIEYLSVTDNESELWNPIGMQVDFWARGWAKTERIEQRIRTLTTRDTSQVLGGERVWMKFMDANTIDYPQDASTVHRVLDFTFEALRGKYVGQ